jgi:dimeric dUTPase (all-alpha-NTP-PPase superfamily)
LYLTVFQFWLNNGREFKVRQQDIESIYFSTNKVILTLDDDELHLRVADYGSAMK